MESPINLKINTHIRCARVPRLECHSAHIWVSTPSPAVTTSRERPPLPASREKEEEYPSRARAT